MQSVAHFFVWDISMDSAGFVKSIGAAFSPVWEQQKVCMG
jgi:hypothetical protein